MSGPGTGGLIPPPINAPAGVPTPTGVQAGVSQANVIANRVIIIGTNGELLVYNPSAGAGNLVVSIAGVAGTDSFGDTVKDGITIYHGTADVQIHVNASAGAPAMEMPTGAASEQDFCTFYSVVGNAGLSNEFITLNINGPGSTFDGLQPAIQMSSSEANGATIWGIFVTGPTHFNEAIYGTGGVLTIGDTLIVDGNTFNATSLAFLSALLHQTQPTGSSAAPANYNQAWGTNMTNVLNNVITTLAAVGVWS